MKYAPIQHKKEIFCLNSEFRSLHAQVHDVTNSIEYVDFHWSTDQNTRCFRVKIENAKQKQPQRIRCSRVVDAFFATCLDKRNKYIL